MPFQYAAPSKVAGSIEDQVEQPSRCPGTVPPPANVSRWSPGTPGRRAPRYPARSGAGRRCRRTPSPSRRRWCGGSCTMAWDAANTASASDAATTEQRRQPGGGRQAPHGQVPRRDALEHRLGGAATARTPSGAPRRSRRRAPAARGTGRRRRRDARPSSRAPLRAPAAGPPSRTAPPNARISHGTKNTIRARP